MAMRVLWLGVLVAFVFAENIRANDAPIFTGSALKVDDIPGGFEAVFIGTISNLGAKARQSVTINGPTYQRVRIAVVQILRGSINGAQTSVTLFTDLRLHEELPKVGAKYIIFVSVNDKTEYDNPDPFYARKILPASKKNIASVERLIARLPAK